MQIRYTSELRSECLEELQELMFFNLKQQEYRPSIVLSVEQFGEPVVNSDGGLLRVRTSRLGEVQALFALEESTDTARPVGVIIYSRNAEDSFTLLHVAVDEDFASDGPHAEEMVTLNLFRRLIKVGRQIKGVERVVVLYGPENNTEIPIRR
jgi:hypothetical protein